MFFPINEITVWADKLEDEGTDVSLIRLLCSNNFLCNVVMYSEFVSHFFHGDGNCFGTGNGSSHKMDYYGIEFDEMYDHIWDFEIGSGSLDFNSMGYFYESLAPSH